MRWILALAVLLPLSARAADDILIADFEGDTYGDWTTTGTAFGPGPARGALAGQMAVTGFLGKGLVNSFHGGDDSTGTLTSPAFKIQRNYINFLVGGGKFPGETCINLKLDGKVVRTATGPNDRPGGNEELDWHSWDVGDLIGKSAVIEIVDMRKGGWGHINVDHIVMSDKRRDEEASWEFTVRKMYLHLPVKTGAKMRRMKFVVDGKTVREFDIELADDPSFFVFADVSAFQGKSLRIETKGLAGLSKIAQSDELPDAEKLYREKYRPQFHFTSRRGWLNDPNGLVYADGEYHLFYQHNPYGWAWGNMHWGHAVSQDLVHWTELPIALYPPRYRDWCFSGSAFVDHTNKRLAAAFTSTARGECLIFSQDGGRTWTEAANNPVVKHVGRDPKVIWHEPTRRWVMAVYDEFQGKQRIAFHSSADLKDWKFESRIEGFFECPDFFELPVAGDAKTRKWVLSAADGKYVLGQFDGREFKPETPKLQVWHGNFYAAQTYSDVPDGRRIQIGWGNGITFPGMPFNQQMTVPCQLTLRPTSAGVRLFAEPVAELDRLAAKRHDRGGTLKSVGNLLAGLRGDLFDIRAEIELAGAEEVGIVVRGIPVTYDVKKRELTCKTVKAALMPIDGRIRLRILVDRGSIEVFANDGRVALSVGVIPNDRDLGLTTICRGEAKARVLEVAELRSAWR
ncbi:MAG: GH32 C-terminal domain-containing protein [Gemmataceae bacterium]